jgi:hypothetical protein
MKRARFGYMCLPSIFTSIGPTSATWLDSAADR